MALGIAELAELEEDILQDLPNKITHILSRANRLGQIEELLELLDMKYLMQPVSSYDSYKNGKIVVIGGSEVKEDILLSIASKLGLEKKRFVFCLDYDKTQKYDYHKLQYAPIYRVVLFGPVPHSSTGKKESRSVIAEMENKDGYPRIIRLGSSQAQKISKTNFKEALEMLIQENYI